MMKSIILIKLIKEFVKNENYKKLKELLGTMHVPDIADILEKLDIVDRKMIYENMDVEDVAILITEINSEYQEEMITLLENHRLKEVLENMSNDDIADIFGEVSEEEVKHLMKLMDDEDREEVKKLVKHESDSAGGLMTTEYFTVFTGVKIKEVIAQLKRKGEDAELIYYIYIIDKSNKLKGVVSLRDIIINNGDIVIDKIMKKNLISVNVETDQEDVASIFSKYDLFAVPVVDEGNKLIGIITVDDIIDVMEEEATEDLYAMAGLTENESEKNNIISSVKIRFPWLMVSLFGELISATIMQEFGYALNKIVALAFFIPLIMAMGGNSGSQSSAMMVRKIALGEDEKSKLLKHIWKETVAGVIVGIISGVLVGIISYLWQGNILLSFIISFSLFVAMTWAAWFGSIIPLTFEKFKIDPAVASGPFITTANDVGGILIYFGLATVLMKVLKV
ncbi:magnesium transporter [Haliovirga abyssi]|uniref:Magnesium transporter MgtE n=1 Tax=Haliovirga abyssi TaxID=2996794 RepID=A0AAU9D6D1_9FUSO|nr:magnesium transporter [Haliovirga abyssi]BDU50103.1 magnesium transporter MgtE [Haliovirga abyssi]